MKRVYTHGGWLVGFRYELLYAVRDIGVSKNENGVCLDIRLARAKHKI